MTDKNIRTFHKIISKTLLYLREIEDVEINNISTILLFWELIIIKKLTENNHDLTASLQTILSDCTNYSSINLIDDTLNSQETMFFKKNQKEFLEIFEIIWVDVEKLNVNSILIWEKAFQQYSNNCGLSKNECWQFLNMLNEHFGFDQQYLIALIRIIHKVYIIYLDTNKLREIGINKA